jgi:phosphinothricin tripeptide acetyl hydrolase
MLLLRDRGIALPAGGVCISPWADLTISAESYKTKADVDPMLNKDQLMMMAAAYLAGADPRSPLASPIFADLKGLSPLLIQVGTDEIILDDSLVLAERAKEAGVACTLEVSEEMIHVWHFFYPLVRQGREAIARIGEFVRKEFQIKPDVYRQPI